MKKITFVLFIFFCISCRELVQDTFPDFPKIPTINSLLEAGKPLSMHISFTDKIDTNALVLIENADVNLYVNGFYEEKLNYAGNGIYKSEIEIKQGNFYTCKIIIPDYDTITVSDTIPVSSQIIEVEHIKNAGLNEEGETYPAVQFSFTNDTTKNLYFEVFIKLFINNDVKYATPIYINDNLILNEGLPIAVFSNELIKGNTYTMQLNYTTGQSNNNEMKLYPLVLELRTISYNYYRFVKQIYLYNQGRYPDGLNSNTNTFSIYSNVENGYGIFAGYTKVCTDTIYP